MNEQYQKAVTSIAGEGRFYLKGIDLTTLKFQDERDFNIDDIQAEADKLIVESEIAEKQKAFNNAIQTHLDNKAKEFRYDNIMSARSYAGYENPFQAEAQKLAVWASECWVVAGQTETDVQSGNREIPTVDVFLSELPLFK